MKHVYELIFVTDQVDFRNLLFSSKKRAQEYLEGDYKEGAMYFDERILHSYIIERHLF